MKTLFDKNHRYSHVAQALDIRLGKILSVEFNTLIDRGFSPREIAIICYNVVNEIQLESILNLDDINRDKTNG